MNRTLLSLFSGGGLADWGCRAAGYTPVGAVEWDPQIAAVYATNLGGHIACGPVEETDYRPFAGVSLVWTSPSCVNASVANANGEETEGDRAAAEAIARCLRETRPPRFVLENVWAYRAFAAFQVVLAALQEYGYQWDTQHVNAADFGVPQTRRRLILRARLGQSVPPLVPTHCQGGDAGGLFSECALLPWTGWYEAVEDLIPGLPPSHFATWQLERLPAAFASCLVESRQAHEWGEQFRDPGAPAYTVSAYNRPAHLPKALLVGQQYDRPQGIPERCPQVRVSEEPALPVVASHNSAGKLPKAILVDNGNPNRNEGICRSDDLPAGTVIASQDQVPLRALLVHPTDMRSMACIGKDEPAFTVTTGGAGAARNPSAGFKPRAWLENGRVVQMTPRALARFQSAPDTYQLPEKVSLACRVIGNGVPPLLAQRVAESLEVTS